MKRLICFLMIFSILFGIMAVGAVEGDVPAVPNAFKVVSTTYNSVSLSWDAVDSASGYVVYGYANGEASPSLRNVTLTTNRTVSSLATGSTYLFKVRAYKTADGSNIYGTVSEAVTATLRLGGVTQGYATATAPKNSTKLSWKATAGATGYVVYRSKTIEGGYGRLKVTSAASYITAGRFYFYKVAAFRTVNGVNIYGKPSAAFFTPEISTDGMKSKMPGAEILQAWKIADSQTGTTVTVQKLAYGAPINTTHYNNKYSIHRSYSITQVCFVAIINCKPENFRNTCASLSLNKDEALVNDMAKKSGAIIAINNEAYSGHWSTNPNVNAAFICDGPVVKEGVVVQNRGMSYYGSVIYENGTWEKNVIINPSNVKTLLKNEASYTQSPSTGAYIWGGKQLAKFGSQIDLMNTLRNRTCYAQIDKNNYLLMVGEFMQLDTMISILLKYGAQKGFVCNGGNCTNMYMRGVGNVTGTIAPQLANHYKLNVLEQEWLGSHNYLHGGKGAACPAIDIIYVK